MEMREYIEAIAESCRKLIISKPATKQEEYRKIIVQKKEAFFQMEKYTDKQVFHENLSVEELETALEELMQNHFRQLNGFDIESSDLKERCGDTQGESFKRSTRHSHRT